MFQVNAEGGLSGATSYALPNGSADPVSIAFSPNGLYLATANTYSNNVSIFDVETGGVLTQGSPMPYQVVIVNRARWHFLRIAPILRPLITIHLS